MQDLTEPQRREIEQWIAGLEKLATPSLAGSAVFGEGSANPELRAQFAAAEVERVPTGRAAEQLLVHSLAGVRPSGEPTASASIDDRLWAAVFDADIDPLSMIPGAGSLQTDEPSSSLEAWTEVDLAALHALWWIGVRGGEVRVQERTREAVLWHVDTIQPDNGTGRPWAVQAFAWIGVMEDDHAARLHAQGLVHASRLAGDRPDRFTACILLDAARGLRAAIGS
ncbi:MAG: hypothetical protein ACF8SC_12345 [Phycisphaerales bacterium JB037]